MKLRALLEKVRPHRPADNAHLFAEARYYAEELTLKAVELDRMVDRKVEEAK